MLYYFSKNQTATKQDTADGKIEGSIVSVWVKDPSVTSVGTKGTADLFLVGKIEDGPKDKDIVIQGMPIVQADVNGDFNYNPNASLESFDTVHTFSYVHRTLNMYRQILLSQGIQNALNWQWGASEPIQVSPYAGVDENAYYSREEKCLKFFYFQSEVDPSERIYTCRAQDVVSHETGHAVLDALCPGFMESYLPQTGAMHEAFGDITSLFVLLSDPQVCEQVILKSKGNLYLKDLFLPDLANQFGSAIKQHGGLRNANNSLTLSQVGDEVHALSQVFTGAIYDVLADMFAQAKDPFRVNPTMTLFNVSAELTSLLVRAMISSPAKNASFGDVANRMIALTPNVKLKASIEKVFAAREVNLKATLDDVPMEHLERADFSNCSRTLNTPEFEKRRALAVEDRKQELELLNQLYFFSPRRLFGK